MKYVHIAPPLLFLMCLSIQAQTTQDARTLYLNGSFAESKVLFEHQLKQNPKGAEANYYLGMISMRSDLDYDKAVQYLEKAVDGDPNNAKYFFDLGQAYGLKARTSNFAIQMITAPKVKSAFEKAVALDGTLIDARQGLLQYYLIAPGIMGGSISKARDQAQEILKLDAFQGYLALAGIAEKDDDVTSMEIYCSKAAEANPKSNQPYNRLGYLYLKKDRVDDAIVQFRKMVEVQPNDPNSYDSLGDGLFAKDLIDDAIDAYQKALATDPNFSPSAYNLGQCFFKKKMKADADKYFRLYLKIAPNGRYAKDAKEKLSD